MRSFRSDPYLWVHLAGVAAVPIFLELCLLGLGIGNSLMPLWFELVFVGGLGIAPILWMQWQKPFSIFSLLLLAIRPDRLSEEQRKILSLFKAPVNRILAVLVAIALTFTLWQLYCIAPITSGRVLPNATRGVGLLIAAIAFFFSNLFLQVPVSVLRVLLVGENTFEKTEPYPVEQISTAFTVLGLRVKKILPTLMAAPSKPVVIRPEAPLKEEKEEVLETVDEVKAVATETVEGSDLVIEVPDLADETSDLASEAPDLAIEVPDAHVEGIEESIDEEAIAIPSTAHVIELEVIALEADLLQVDVDEEVDREALETVDEADEADEEDWGDEEDLHA
jgi:hypothetical protein